MYVYLMFLSMFLQWLSLFYSVTYPQNNVGDITQIWGQGLLNFYVAVLRQFLQDGLDKMFKNWHI